MGLSLVTAPAAEPVSSTEAKLHLKVDTTADDGLITALITAAREYAEAFTRRAFITQTWDYKLDSFPCSGGPIALPKAPCQSVTSVTYVDTAGATQTWTAGSTGYTTDIPAGPHAGPALVYPAYGVYYPSTRDQHNAVTVTYVAGYGDTSADVPSSIVAAMKLLIGHWYLNREAAIVGAITSEVKIAVDALLYPFFVATDGY